MGTINKTEVRIHRTSQYMNKLRAYSIICDGTKIGKVKDGETVSFPISEGRHKIYLRIDWLKSNTVEFAASTDSLVNLLATINTIKDLNYRARQVLGIFFVVLAVSLSGIYTIAAIVLALITFASVLNKPLLKKVDSLPTKT